MKNRSRNLVLFMSTLILVLLSSTVAFAAEVEPAVVNSERFGVLTLIPPLVAIILAFITKNVVISLFIGTLSGCFMVQLAGYNVFGAFIQAFLDFVQRALNSLADPWNAGIVLQVLVIGGVINLISKMGGARAVAEALAKMAKTPRSTQIVTWLLGLFVFFDDYANALIVGPIMKPVADKMKVSREKLSFIIDATARFYNILILAFVVISAILLRDFGPMRKAEIKARRGEQELKDIAIDEDTAEEFEAKSGIKLSIWNAIIPIGTLIVAALASFYYSGYTAIMAGEDIALKTVLTESPFSFTAIQQTFSNADASIALFQAALFASIVALILGVCKKIFTISEGIEIWIDGMKGLIITGVILILAWSLSSVIKELGTAQYLVTLLSDSLPQFLLPSVIFIFGAVISFATGTAYGTMGILMPLAIPLAHAISPDMTYIIMSTSAVLTGAIFGDHCSPISDTTIMSSMGAGCDHIAHVKTQMWYSLFVAVLTILFGYIPVGLGLPVYIVLPLSIIGLGLLIYFIGRPVDEVEA